MAYAGFAVAGIIALYFVWRVFYSIWNKLRGLGIEHEYYSSDLFDIIFGSAIWGLLIARIVWMVLHREVYSEIPWSILPYYRVEETSETVWLSFLPWNTLNVFEGIILPIMLGAGAVISIIRLLPTVRLIRNLKLEKRGIVKNMLLQVFGALLIIAVYYSSFGVYFEYFN